jgi:hypothetical protein
MSRVIYINNMSDVPKAQKELGRIEQRLIDKVSDAMMSWGKTLENEMKNSAHQAYIQPFTGNIYGKGIQYRQKKGSSEGFLFMNQYALALDRMKIHGVYVTRSRSRLLSWASQAINPEIRRGARSVMSGKNKKFVIVVKPHPFIERGFNRAYQKFGMMLKRNTSIVFMTG